MNEKRYKTLKVGDVRMLGDEVRALQQGKPFNEECDYCQPSHWSHVSLIGHVILPADLFNAEFRRRII